MVTLGYISHSTVLYGNQATLTPLDFLHLKLNNFTHHKEELWEVKTLPINLYSMVTPLSKFNSG